MDNRSLSTAGKVNKLLETYNFEITDNVPKNLACEICKNLLVNACQSRCGCRFCSKCIKEYLSKGNVCCPGNTSDCKEENLSTYSNIHTDYRVIRKISKLRVKCPEETCQVFCELIDMDEHLRLCTMKNVKCPFFAVGCNETKILIKDMNIHLQNGIYLHSKLLIDIISNLRNDVTGLFKNENELHNEIVLLRENLRIQNEKINLLNNEVAQLKLEKRELSEQLEIFKACQEIRIEEVLVEANLDFAKTKADCTEMLNVEILKVTEDFANYKVDIELKLKEIERHLKRKIDESSGIFSWNINGVSAKREDNQSIFSEYFYTKINRHKISLQLAANGTNDIIGMGFSVFLFVYSGIQDIELIWPFEGNITIKIVNKSHPDVFKTMSKFCKIDKPPNNYNWSDPFYFNYDELYSAGLVHDDCFTIECFVDEK